MILPRVFIAAVLGLAACQSAPTETSAEVLATASIIATAAPPSPSVASSPSATPIRRASPQTRIVQVSTVPPPTDIATTRWLETEMNGVRIGMWRPDGWDTDVSDGLVLIEKAGDHMSIYVFVPHMSEFHLTGSGSANNALDMLNQVVKMPNYTGHDVKMTEPTAFHWDNHQAAYYLLSAGDGARMLVLAVSVPNQQQVVVCTISMEVGETSQIRTALPYLLDGLMIEGTSLRGASLSVLPDPLPFPRYYQMSQSSGR